jgi:hypothetical protein
MLWQRDFFPSQIYTFFVSWKGTKYPKIIKINKLLIIYYFYC